MTIKYYRISAHEKGPSRRLGRGLCFYAHLSQEVLLEAVDTITNATGINWGLLQIE
jgi:hypothetical protein